MFINNNKWITVPKNPKGYNEYDLGIEHTENMDEFALSLEECRELYRSGVFQILESTYRELYIEDAESNTITSEQLEAVYDEISSVKGVFLTAVDLAIKYGTCVFLDF